MPEETILKPGLQIKPRDSRNFTVGALFTLPKLKTLPKHFQLPYLEIKDQGSNDHCVGNAIAADSEVQEGVILDEDFAFHAGRAVAENKPDWGLTIQDGLRGAVKYGCAEKRQLVDMDRRQFNYLDDYPEVIINSARPHCKKAYVEIVPYGKMDAFDTLKCTLYKFRAKKQGAITGTFWNWPLSQRVMNDFYLFQGTPHCMRLIGWKEINNIPYMIYQNSAGKKAGHGGLHYFGRDLVNKSVGVFQAFMQVDYTKEELKLHLEAGTKVDKNWVSNLLRSFINLFKSQ